jgi:hypothetical protein
MRADYEGYQEELKAIIQDYVSYTRELRRINCNTGVRIWPETISTTLKLITNMNWTKFPGNMMMPLSAQKG